MKRIVQFSLAVLCLTIVTARAGELAIQVPDGCGDWRVLVEDQPLSRVLEKLSERLTFNLYFTVSADRRVSATLEQQPVELLRMLLAHDGIMLVERYDPVCGRAMPASLWVLGEGEYNPDQAIRYAPAPAPVVRETELTPQEIAEKKQRGRRRHMTPEERYNEKIRRRLEKDGAAMVSGENRK